MLARLLPLLSVGWTDVRRRRVGTTIPENRNGSARVKENHAAGFTALLVILLNPGI